MTGAWTKGDLALVMCSDGTERLAYATDRLLFAEKGMLEWKFLHNGLLRDLDHSEARPVAVVDPRVLASGHTIDYWLRQAAEIVHQQRRPTIARIVTRLSDDIAAQIPKPPPEVHRHLVVATTGDLKTSICGKVWRTDPDAIVTRTCEECAEHMAKDWSP